MWYFANIFKQPTFYHEIKRGALNRKYIYISTSLNLVYTDMHLRGKYPQLIELYIGLNILSRYNAKCARFTEHLKLIILLLCATK